MVLQSVLLIHIGKQNVAIIDVYVETKKVKMNYSCHGRYEGIHLVF